MHQVGKLPRIFVTGLTGVLISPCSDQAENKLQRQKILSFTYPIYNHNWRNISTIYIYIYIYISRLASKEKFSPSKKMHREVGQVSDVPRNYFRGGSTNSVEDRGERERGSGGGSPPVRGSGGSCNLVQEISFHMVKFS